MTNPNDVEQRARTMDELVRRLESEGDPGVRATARELVQALLEFHAAGLNRMMEIVDEAGVVGAAIINRLGEDEIVKPLLLLHTLHPLDLQTRVADALERTRPLLHAHGGEVECLGVDDSGIVTLRLDASGCGSANGTLEAAVTEARREAAPDITRLVVEHASEPAGAVAFVPVGELLRNRVPIERSVE
jgi:Fe-S cluster biogenesis protein NfuA